MVHHLRLGLVLRYEGRDTLNLGTVFLFDRLGEMRLLVNEDRQLLFTVETGDHNVSDRLGTQGVLLMLRVKLHGLLLQRMRNNLGMLLDILRMRYDLGMLLNILRMVVNRLSLNNI